MADDLDALFGAFDGEDDDQENDEIQIEKANAKTEGIEDDKTDSKKRKVDDDDDDDAEMSKNDGENTDGRNNNHESEAGDAKAVSSMYADVFSQSSMQHAVGQVKKKKDPTSADKDAKMTEAEANAMLPCMTCSAGSCVGLYTANTMATVTESLGMSLTKCATTLALDPLKKKQA